MAAITFKIDRDSYLRVVQKAADIGLTEGPLVRLIVLDALRRGIDTDALNRQQLDESIARAQERAKVTRRPRGLFA